MRGRFGQGNANVLTYIDTCSPANTYHCWAEMWFLQWEGQPGGVSGKVSAPDSFRAS